MGSRRSVAWFVLVVTTRTMRLSRLAATSRRTILPLMIHDGDRVNWSDDDEEYPKHESTLNNAFTIKRKSISRKPIRSKGGRQSSMSIHSVTTVSSEEGINPAISVVSVSQAGVLVEPDMQRVKVPGVAAKQPAPSKVQTLLRATPDFQSPTFRRHSNV